MYSTAQMDNFYYSFSKGIIKTSGVMNYLQHLYIAKNIPNGANVLEVCCGRCLLVPLIDRYSKNISYTGIDISAENLNEAKELIKDTKADFPIQLLEMDVTKLIGNLNRKFDIIVYTSSIEHMSKENGILSLENASKMLSKGGIMYLSSPRTKKQVPYKLQYKVHVYEWDMEELEIEINNFDFKIIDKIGLLIENIELFLKEVKIIHGKETQDFIKNIINKVPVEFAEPIIASSFPNLSKEILYVCKKQSD